LGIAAELVGLSVRFLCGGEVAEAPANLADLVKAARSDLTLEVLELRARRHRDLLRRLEIAAKAHDLGAMDAAGAREPRDVELIAPAVRDIGPFGRPPVVAEVVAGADRHAVDDRRGVRLELAAHRGGGRFVEQLQTRVDLAALHERASLPDEGEHLRVAVSEAPAELEGTVEVGDRGREVALGEERADRADERGSRASIASGSSSSKRCASREPSLRDGEHAPRPDSSQESLRATRAASLGPSAA
jgi:hypothetical protein